MRMGGNGIPQDHTPFGAEFVENAVDDRSGGLLPRSRAAARPPVGIAPAQQVELAGKRDAGPAHPLVAGRFSNGDHISLSPLLKVMPQVGESDRWRIRHI